MNGPNKLSNLFDSDLFDTTEGLFDDLMMDPPQSTTGGVAIFHREGLRTSIWPASSSWFDGGSDAPMMDALPTPPDPIEVLAVALGDFVYERLATMPYAIQTRVRLVAFLVRGAVMAYIRRVPSRDANFVKAFGLRILLRILTRTAKGVRVHASGLLRDKAVDEQNTWRVGTCPNGRGLRLRCSGRI